MRSLKLRSFVAVFCGMLSMYDACAGGFYVSDLDREYDEEYEEEYVPAPRPRPRTRKVYVYREPAPRPRPRQQEVYVYREPAPRPRPRQQEVYVYDDQPSAPINSRPSRRDNYGGPSFFSQNNFLMFKLGGYKIDSFGGNSDISNGAQGYTFGAGVGHAFNNYINGSIELDVFSKAKGEKFDKDQNELRKWDLSSNMLTANAAISLFPGQNLDFYVKVGMGMSYNKSSNYVWTSGTTKYYYPGESSFNFAWRGGFGMKVNTLPDIDTGIEYMFTDRGAFKTQNMRRVGNTDQINSPKEASFTDHTVSIVVTKKLS